MPFKIRFVLVPALHVLIVSGFARADPGVWASSTFTLDSFCLAEAHSPVGSELISGIGEGFDTSINNFAFAALADNSMASTASNAFSRFGPNAGMPRGDRIIIEGFSKSRLAPEPTWTVGRALGHSSVRSDFSLPFGGRFRILDGWFQRDSSAASATVTLGVVGGAPTFSYSEPEDLPAGVFGVLPPGNYTLFFGSSAQTMLGSSLELSAEISYAFDLQVLANLSCPGDFDADSQVDDSDFAPFALAYNVLDCADSTMPPDCPADLDFNGFVDDADFVLFAAAYDALLCP